MKKFFSFGISAVSILVPTAVSAAACSTPTSTTGFNNPLTICNIQNFVSTTLQILVVIALPIIGFFIVLAGFNFITARGNASKLAAAKQNFLYVIIGAALVLGAWALANLIGATISQITG